MSDNTTRAVTSYWNGELSGAVNIIYNELINVDPDILPDRNKLGRSSYFLWKRKGYVQSFRSAVGNDFSVGEYKTTDIRKIDRSGCEGGDCYRMFYQVSKDQSSYRVMRIDCNKCNTMYVVDEGTRCDCAYDRFFDLDFPLNPTGEGVGKQEIRDGIVFSVLDSNINGSDPDGYSVGDYILFHDIKSSGSGDCGTYRQIAAIGDGYFDLDTGFTYTQEGDGTGEIQGIEGNKADIGYTTFRDFGKTVGWIGSDGITVYTGKGYKSTIGICDTRNFGCIQSISNHNGIINILNDKGNNFYGGVGGDQLIFAGTNYNHVGTDKLVSVSFGNFLVFFGKGDIKSVAFTDDGKYAYDYDLSSFGSADIGIFSKDAYAVFDNGLYFLGSDKRLYAATISGNGSRYYLKLEDQSEFIFPDLDLIQDGDDVHIESSGNKLYIFINGRYYQSNDSTDKTKILIFNRDYTLRYKHIVPRGNITGTRYGLFYGDGLYDYASDTDFIYTNSENRDGHYANIKSEIEFDIVNSENHGIQNSNGNRVSLMTEKKVNRMKLLLGPGRYTDDTYVEVESFIDGYRLQKQIHGLEDNERIENQNHYRNGNYDRIKVSPCFDDLIGKCDSMDNPCVGSENSTLVREDLSDPVCLDYERDDFKLRPHIFDDYAICYDDKGYQLSPINHIRLNFGNKYPAILHRIRIISEGSDVISYGGSVVEYDSYDITHRSHNAYDMENICCKKKPGCPDDGC